MGTIQKINVIKNYLEEIVNLLGSGQLTKADSEMIDKIYQMVQ